MKIRILHLEDNVQDAERVEACLSGEGVTCEILSIDSRDGYVTALDRGGFDLILADYSLASFDGLSALSIAKEKCPDTPFILVTGALGEEAAVECLKLGATDYVLKQHLSRLVPCIKRALHDADDLQARKFAEAQMPLQFAALRAAVNGIVITDRQGHIVWVNPAFGKLTGYASQDAIGRTPRLLKSGKHNQRFYEDLWKTILSGEVWSGEMVNRRKDGTLYTEEQTITPVKDDKAQISHFIAIKQDITKRKKAEEALTERMQLAEFSAEIGSALATDADLRGMLQKCAEVAVQHLNAAFARIWTLNARENILELQASAGMYTHIDGGHGRVPVGQFKIGLIAQERRPHLTNSVVGDPRVNDQEWAKRESMVGFAGYPLLVDGRLVGVIAMFTRQPIPAATFEAMASGANEIAVGIERKLAEQRAQDHFNRIRVLHEIDQAITSTLELSKVLDVILNSVAQFFPRAAAVGIALRDPGSGALEPVACRGMMLEEWKRAFFTGDSFINSSALVGPLAIADLRAAPNVLPAQREFVEKTGHQSLLVVPIPIDDRILGVMGFATIIKYDFSSNEIEFLSTLAGQAAVAIQNAELYQETKKQQSLLIEQEHVQRILKELSQDITKMDVDALLEKLTGTIREVFRVEISDVRFLAGAKWANITVASEDLIQRLPEGGEFRQGATDWVLQNRKLIAIDDYQEQKEFMPGRVAKMFGVRGFLAAPMLTKSGEVIGVIRALSKQPRTFTAQEIDLFEQLANGAAVAIENERLYVDLEKSDKIKSEFLGVMSHELRTPLNIIMGYAALLKDDLVDDTDQGNRSAVVTIETQANELLTMVSSIMQATQIESGATPVHKHEVDVGLMMQDLKALYDAPLDKNLALVWKYPPTLPTLVTDNGMLIQVLRKLIDNAIKFTKAGTVTVSARVNGNFEFQVSDTGVGIPEESLSVIFDIFKQVDSSSTREFSGAGLGLYIARKFTEHLGGSIEVESAVGKGSTFTIKIPCQ